MIAQQLKICFFNSDPKWGGGVTFYKDHTKGIQKLGHKVIAVCAPGSMLSKVYHDLGIPQWNLFVGRLSFVNIFKLIKLIRFYRREQVDVVVFTTSEDLKLGGFAAKIAGVPKIVYRRGLAVLIKNRWTNRLLFRNVLTHIIANSEETKRTILANLSNVVKADDITVIYNGIDIQKFGQEVEPLFEKTQKIIIGNAGRLSEEKGQHQLIDIAKILRSQNLDFKIVIAGNGSLSNKLHDLIRDNDLQACVELMGYVEEMDRFMRAIDIFVLTSHWEGFGYVMVEAMLQRKPVVAYNISSMPEVVLDKRTGMLAEYSNTSDLAKKIALLYHDDELRKQYGDAGYQSAVERFELQRQIKKFEQLILS